MADSRTFEDVLDFWFSDRARALWFEKDEAFDADMRDRFADAQAAAHDGALDHWAAVPRGAMALVLLLDQMPRNIYRGTPRMYDSDPKARDLARDIRAKGFDLFFADPRQRAFCYLPFEHSEDMADQDLCVRLFRAHCLPRHVEFGEAHRTVIRRFGRFPHRNQILGRANTPEEEEYLKDPDAGW